VKKTVLQLLGLVTALGLVIAVTAPALAGQGIHIKGQAKGYGAQAAWNFYDQVLGIQTDLRINFDDNFERNPPDSPVAGQFANISISQYYTDPDGLNYVPIRDIYFYGEVPPGAIAIGRTLNSASLVLSGVIGEQFDYDSMETSDITIDIDVSWSATSPISMDHWNTHMHYINGFAFYRYHGKSRDAATAGQITFGDTSIALGSAYWASVYYAKTGEVHVSR